MDTEFWNAILPEYSEAERRENFVKSITNVFDHRTAPYPKIIRGWSSFFVMYFRYIFLQGDQIMWEGNLCQLNNPRLYMVFSPDIKGDDSLKSTVDKTVKKTLRKLYASKNTEHRLLLEKIESFFKKLYEKALASGCEFNKKSDWQTFYENLDIDEVVSCYKECGLSLFEEDFKAETSSSDVEETDEIDEEFGTYDFDELSDEYIALIQKHMPHICSIDDYNAISWFMFGEDKYCKSKFKQNGLLGWARSNNPDKFYDTEFGKNVQLDTHFVYAFALELLNMVYMHDLMEVINETARDLLTLSKEAQEKCVKDGRLSSDVKCMVVLDFFFNKLTEFAKHCLVVTGLSQQFVLGNDKKTYNIALEFLEACIFDSKHLVSLKDCINEIVPSELL